MALAPRLRLCPPEGHCSGCMAVGCCCRGQHWRGLGAPQAGSQANQAGPTFEPRMLWKRGAGGRAPLCPGRGAVLPSAPTAQAHAGLGEPSFFENSWNPRFSSFSGPLSGHGLYAPPAAAPSFLSPLPRLAESKASPRPRRRRRCGPRPGSPFCTLPCSLPPHPSHLALAVFGPTRTRHFAASLPALSPLPRAGPGAWHLLGIRRTSG